MCSVMELPIRHAVSLTSLSSDSCYSKDVCVCVCFSPALDLNGNPWVPYCVAQIVTLLIWEKSVR